MGFFPHHILLLHSHISICLYFLFERSSSIALLGLAGLPPFSLFWGKLLVLVSLPPTLSVWFLRLRGLCLPAYLSYLGCLSLPRHSSPAGLCLPPFLFGLTF